MHAMNPVGVSESEDSIVAGLFHDPQVGAQRRQLAAGNRLFDATDPAGSVFFIVEGQVRTHRTGADGSRRLTDILGPGDWVGSASLGKLPSYFSHAVATVSSVVLEASAERFLEALARRPDAAVVVIRQLARKLYQAQKEADRLVFDDCNQRLLKTLVRFSQSAAAMPHEDGVVLRITHQQLAQAIGVARETVSLALTQLRHRKLLRTGRNQLFFNPENLVRLADAAPAKNGGNGHSAQSRSIT